MAVLLRKRGGRARRDITAPAAVVRRDAASSLGQGEDTVKFGEERRDVGDEQGLGLRDLNSVDDFDRQTDVRDVDYDYIFGGNSVNDDNDDDLMVSSSSSSSQSH